MVTHDLIGIGFGPSNIALAIALDERRHEGRCLESLFIEKQTGFAWHKGMMLDQAHMQISFLKDLATLRNPTSRFTFINYLHEKKRLQDFINLKTFFPSRHEFNDYLTWAANQFDDLCVYGEEVFEVLPEGPDGTVTHLRVRSRRPDGSVHERRARNLVVGIGGTPNVPEPFRALRGDPRVFHSSTYLHSVARLADARRIAVVGAGQSAAEIFMDLQGRPEAPRVDLVMRGRAILPSDDSPFVNEIFNEDFTDFVFGRPAEERAALLQEFRHTNYAVADLELIQQIFKRLYEQKVAGEERLRILRHQQVRLAQGAADGIHLLMNDTQDGTESSTRYDAVVLATGYVRDHHRTLLSPLMPYLGDMTVDRRYRVASTPDFQPAIFLQGACEASHGLSDTLLSVTSVRTGEIGSALVAKAGHAQGAASVASPRSARRAVSP